jgi:hypothetical protein
MSQVRRFATTSLALVAVALCHASALAQDRAEHPEKIECEARTIGGGLLTVTIPSDATVLKTAMITYGGTRAAVAQTDYSLSRAIIRPGLAQYTATLNRGRDESGEPGLGWALSVLYQQPPGRLCVFGTSFLVTASSVNDAFKLVAPVEKELVGVSAYGREALPRYPESSCGQGTIPMDVRLVPKDDPRNQTSLEECKVPAHFPPDGGLAVRFTYFESANRKHHGVHVRCGNASDKRQRECRAEITYRP